MPACFWLVLQPELVMAHNARDEYRCSFIRPSSLFRKRYCLEASTFPAFDDTVFDNDRVVEELGLFLQHLLYLSKHGMTEKQGRVKMFHFENRSNCPRLVLIRLIANHANNLIQQVLCESLVAVLVRPLIIVQDIVHEFLIRSLFKEPLDEMFLHSFIYDHPASRPILYFQF